ncbi:MAG: SDR family oxidoreductase [Anaerolineae bacterium]|nr:SDR family oxidoreductase [Anaerolineae bacterium]
MIPPLITKVIILTGASAGIGRATAVALAQSGAHVVLVARSAERLDALVTELAGYAGQRLAIAGDVGDESLAETVMQQTIATFGKVDVLINNAGIGHKSSLAEIRPADMRRLLDTNVLGLLYLTQTAVTQMQNQGYGHIINISSIVGERPLPNMGLYCASKTAVNFISRTLQMELRRSSIRLTIVYPGRTASEFGERLLGEPSSNWSSLARVPAERVAQAILKAIHTGKAHVTITWLDWLFMHISRLFPRTTDWLTWQLNSRLSR